MKDIIQKLEVVLNQGLYGREDEVRLALLCVLANKPLFLYGHDDSMEIKMRFDALFGETPIQAKVCQSSTIKHKYKIHKYTAYCFLGNHTSSDHLYEYLFSTKSENVIDRLKQFSSEAQKIKEYFKKYDFSKFWNNENKTSTIDFIEALTNYHIISHDRQPIESEEEDSKDISSLVANISDKHFKDFLHLLAINLLINDKASINPMDFGMFYYCLRGWADGIKYLEETICLSLANEFLPTFVFRDEESEKRIKEDFFLEYERKVSSIPHSELMVYVPYSSYASESSDEIFATIKVFHDQLAQITNTDSDPGLDSEMHDLEMKEEILKKAQLEEMELKESQLAQVQLKRSAFKTVKDGLDERLKIATSKETELREQRETLENKFKDSKIAGQREGYEAQIAEVKAREDQYKEIRLNLEGQLQDAKNVLEDKLKQTKEVLEAKLKEIQAKEADVKAARVKLNAKLAAMKGDSNSKLRQAKEYLSQLRGISPSLHKAIEACDTQMKLTSKPNPICINPLKLHAFGLKKVQKNLANMIRIFDTQVKHYEENTKKNLQQN